MKNNPDTMRKFDEEFPETQKEVTHFDECKCWSCNDYRNKIKQFMSDKLIDKKIVEEEIDKVIKRLDNTDFVSSRFLLEDLKQSLLNK